MEKLLCKVTVDQIVASLGEFVNLPKEVMNPHPVLQTER